MKPRNLQGAIKKLEESKNIKILGIESLEETLSRATVESALNSLTATLEKIDLEDNANYIEKKLKGSKEYHAFPKY